MHSVNHLCGLSTQMDGSMRLATDFGAVVVFDATDDFGTELGDFFVAEGAFGAPQGDTKRQAAHAVAQICAGVDVEEFDTTECVAGVLADRRFDGLCTDRSRCNEREVLAGRRVARDAGVAGHAGVGKDELEVEFGDGDAHGGDVEAVAGVGVEFTERSDNVRLFAHGEDKRCAAAGLEVGQLGCCHADAVDVQAFAEEFNDALDVVEVNAVGSGGVPGGGVAFAGDDDGDAQRLGRQDRVGAAMVDMTDFEQSRHAALADVDCGRFEQGGEDVAAHILTLG